MITFPLTKSRKRKVAGEFIDGARTVSSLLVRSHANGVVTTVEDDELGLEEDVTIDGEVSGRSLNTTEASCGESTRLVEIP